MMYSEFLLIGGEKVKHITFSEYSALVEPLYMEIDVEKHIFVEKIVNLFTHVEDKTVAGVINNMSYESRVDLAAGEPYIAECVQKVALEARKLCYQMIRLEAFIF